MAFDRLPRGVGYWGSGDLPHPGNLVRSDNQYNNREQIVSYLRRGHVFNVWSGLARCRIEACGELLGSCDLTDGEWIWPQKLDHYVTEHAVCLPEAFVETMRSNNWNVPTVLNDSDYERLEDQLVAAGHGSFGDLTFWKSWARSFAVSAKISPSEVEPRDSS